MVDREKQDGDDDGVLGQAEDDVGDGLGRGVDGQAQARLRGVAGERGRPAKHGANCLAEVVGLAGEQRTEDRTERRPDRRMDGIPDVVDVGDLVGDELDREKGRGREQDLGPLEDVRYALDASVPSQEQS